MEIDDKTAELLREKIILKKRLKAIDDNIADIITAFKKEMRDKELKSVKFEDHGLKINYSPPRKYRDFHDKKMALNYLMKNRPDLVVDKKGYERLTINLLKV